MKTKAEFTNSQKEYLSGFFAAVGQRWQSPFVGQTDDGRFTATPDCASINLAEEETYFGTPVDELCKEELIKRELNGLDCFDRIEKAAESGTMVGGSDIFRFKYYGLFNVSPAQDGYMLRCRIPGGILNSRQLEGLAEIAEDWAGGYSDITTRANLQFREISPENSIKTINKLVDLGITSRGSGADNLRNITCSPTAGFDPEEIHDTRALAKAMHHCILNSRDLYGLPRKFNISFDGGGSVSVCADTNDIAFYAVRVGEGHEVEPGIYYRVQLAGITGHKQFAKDSGVLIKPEQCVATAAAMVRVFIENGDRTNRKKARLKYLIDKWGMERFLLETQKKLDFKLHEIPLSHCECRAPVKRRAHIGVHPQTGSDMSYVGVVVPVGRLTPDQIRRIASIARTYGKSEVRLTVWQNLLIPHIENGNLDFVRSEILDAGLGYDAKSIIGGLVACTGNAGCKYAAANTKRHAVELAGFLGDHFELDEPINLHLTGCHHSCAQHYVGDIGLQATKVKVGDESVEGYSVVVGGGVDDQQAIAKELFKGVAFTSIKPLLKNILERYLENRHEGERFFEFNRSRSIEDLRALYALPEIESSGIVSKQKAVMNLTNSPFIPENAPFTDEQRSYLNGFLAGLFSSNSPTLAETVKTGLTDTVKKPVTILWGSQTGNTETLAKKAAKRLSKAGYQPIVSDMGDYDKSKLAEEKTLLIMTSTYGDGDPPDNAMDLHSWLRSSDAPRLDGLRYSVLALGDTNYPDFCKCGIEFDERLAELGGIRMTDRVDCDVDFDEPFEVWLESIEAQNGIGREKPQPDVSSTASLEKTEYGKKNPYFGRILNNVNLNGAKSAKETRHIEISLEGSGLVYEPGDALAILPQNDASSVDELIGLLGFECTDAVLVPGGERKPLRDALVGHYDISKLSLKIAKIVFERGRDEGIGALVSDKESFNQYAQGRQLVDLLRDYNGNFETPDEFVSILSKLAPRLYSISSSPNAHSNEVHITVGVVRYESCGLLRKGVCSNFLAGQPVEDRVGLFFHHSKTFKLPENGEVPIIMVGPGTGIAPFRAFIEERKATGAKGENWLFFGDQKAESDFLYKDELEDYFRQGHLHRLDTAFSRDQSEKVYVQNKMLENGAELYAWLERGAYFYVCGDASRMAKDVDAALHEIVEKQGQLDAAAAQAYVKQLKAEKRYLRDVYQGKGSRFLSGTTSSTLARGRQDWLFAN